LGGAAATWPLIAVAQQVDRRARVPRLGVLWSLGDHENSADFLTLNKAFADLGYIARKNIEFINLFPFEQNDYPALARQLGPVFS
jgi:hypothetical protein